jgi:FAD/FMN-containing dehydrogenase
VDGTFRSPATCRCTPTRPLDACCWSNRGPESEAHARARFEALLEAALEARLIDDAVVAESLAQAGAVAPARVHPAGAGRGRPEHQARHLAAGVGASRLRASHRRRAAAAIPGVRLVNFGHLGDGNLHYNVQAPKAVMRPSCATQEAASTRIVYDAVAGFGGSISAEHGIGSLKAHELPSASRRWRCS